MHVDRFAVILNQFQSVAVNLKQFLQVWLRQKTQEFSDNRKVGKTSLGPS